MSRPALTSLERLTLEELAAGLGSSEAGGEDGRHRRGVAWRMRDKLGARTNAHAVALAFRLGLLEPTAPDTWGLLAMMAVRFATDHEDPRYIPLVVGILRDYPMPPLRVAEDIAHHVRRALDREPDFVTAEHLRDLLALMDEVVAARVRDTSP